MTGEPIVWKDGAYQVPERPIIPFIEGDGTGPDIWAASRLVFEGAVERALRSEPSVANTRPPCSLRPLIVL